ncbi:MAG TPA: hypothetical protein VGC07_06220 [Granulicella sp.]
MRLRLLAVLAGMALATGSAVAQSSQKIGIYATPYVSRISNSKADTGVFAFLGEGATSRFFEGFGVGVYDEFYHTPRFDAGVDVRTKIIRGAGAQYADFLLGGRVSFKPKTLPISPYIDLLGGAASTRAAHNPRSLGRATYSISAGADWHLSRVIDFRIIEVGYSSLTTMNTSIVNTQATAFPSSQVINLSTGLVFRIH